MPTIAEIVYHRSFLSSYYLENLRSPGWFVNKRKPEEIQTIRLRDAEGFEKRREDLAKALKQTFIRGMDVAAGGDFMSNTLRWREGSPPDYMVAEVIVHTSQGAVKHPLTGVTALPNTFQAFNAYPGRQPLHPVLIYPKTDQEFEKYATPWELQFSNLVNPSRGDFSPILDDSYRVVGHQGEVDRAHLKIPLGFQKMMDGPHTYDLLPYLRKAGIPVFVDKGNTRGWEPIDFYTSEHRIDVKTTTDGEVYDFQVTNKGYLVEPWYAPLNLIVKVGEIVLAADIGVKLAAWGVKSVGSIMSRTTARLRSRAVLNGPTEAVAQEARTLEGTRGRLFAKTTQTGDATLAAGEGYTTKFGDVTYSTAGTADDVAAVRFHESVHSFLSPKLNFLREARADFGFWFYKNSKIMKYLEEALAETYTQLRMKGFKGLPTGIRFPVDEGYVTLKALGKESAQVAGVTILVGGNIYGVYYTATQNTSAK